MVFQGIKLGIGDPIFRDQCRDAWSQGQGWGLAGLWLRALVDLGKTSLLEHLRTLHKRESMCRRIVRAFCSFRADRRLQAAFIRVFAVVFVIALVLSALVAYLSPRLYFSTATVEAQQDPQVTLFRIRRQHLGDPVTFEAQLVPPEVGSRRPDFMVCQPRIIESYRILTNAIVNMHLDEKLAQQNGGTCWSIDDTFEFLRSSISIAHTRGTSMIDISVRNPDANLSADIANAVANSYKQYRIDSWNHLQYLQMEAFQSHEPPIRLKASPAPNLVNIFNPARPNRNSIFPTKLKIFLTWIIGGMLLALLAGHRSAR